MSKSIPSTLKGFRDFLPAEKATRDLLERKIVEIFERFGFEPVETPTLEYAALIMGKYGEEADRLVYTFEDRGKTPGRPALRPDRPHGARAQPVPARVAALLPALRDPQRFSRREPAARPLPRVQAVRHRHLRQHRRRWPMPRSSPAPTSRSRTSASPTRGSSSTTGAPWSPRWSPSPPRARTSSRSSVPSTSWTRCARRTSSRNWWPRACPRRAPPRALATIQGVRPSEELQQVIEACARAGRSRGLGRLHAHARPGARLLHRPDFRGRRSRVHRRVAGRRRTIRRADRAAGRAEHSGHRHRLRVRSRRRGRAAARAWCPTLAVAPTCW